MANPLRVDVVLACDECKIRNYHTKKNKVTQPERMEIRKFCKQCGKHTLHRETR